MPADGVAGENPVREETDLLVEQRQRLEAEGRIPGLVGRLLLKDSRNGGGEELGPHTPRGAFRRPTAGLRETAGG